MDIFGTKHEENDVIKHFASFCQHFVLLSPKKKVQKHALLLKNGLATCSVMTSYLVTIVTDSHQTCVKMCLRYMRTATENGRCSDEKSSWKFSRKNL